jgi:hypothetical protein
MRRLALALVLSGSACAVTLQDRPRANRPCTTSGALSAADGMLTIGHTTAALIAAYSPESTFSGQKPLVATAGTLAAAHLVSSLIGRGWANRCRREH